MDLSHVRKLALALPEVTEEPHFDSTSFRIRGKIMATALADELFLNVMLKEPAREPFLTMHPDALEELVWGKKIWGVRVNLDHAGSDLVADLLEQSWKERAPKTLIKNYLSANG